MIPQTQFLKEVETCSSPRWCERKETFLPSWICYLTKRTFLVIAPQKVQTQRKAQNNKPLKNLLLLFIYLPKILYGSASVLFRYPIKSHTDILADLSLSAVVYDTDISNQKKLSRKKKAFWQHAVGFFPWCTLSVIQYKCLSTKVLFDFLPGILGPQTPKS